MIRQIVWYKFKDEVDRDTREAFVDRLRELDDKIGVIEDVSIGTNFDEIKSVHHVTLITDFEGPQAFGVFKDHPKYEALRERAEELCDDVSGGKYTLESS